MLDMFMLLIGCRTTKVTCLFDRKYYFVHKNKLTHLQNQDENQTTLLLTLCQLVPSATNLFFQIRPDKNVRPGPRGYKTFSCSTQLSTKFQLLIKTKIDVSCFKSLRCCNYHANKCCWHFNIYEQDKFRAQLS